MSLKVNLGLLLVLVVMSAIALVLVVGAPLCTPTAWCDSAGQPVAPGAATAAVCWPEIASPCDGAVACEAQGVGCWSLCAPAACAPCAACARD